MASGGSLSDDSDDVLEFGLEDDDVTLPLRIAAHMHVLARREQRRVAQRVEEARASARDLDDSSGSKAYGNSSSGGSSSSSGGSSGGDDAETSTADDDDDDDDYCPPLPVPDEDDEEDDAPPFITSAPVEKRTHSNHALAQQSEKAETSDCDSEGSASDQSEQSEQYVYEKTTESPTPSPKLTDRRIRNIEEAKALAAKADLLISRGEFDGAERVLARAERTEVKAGLIDDVS